MTRFYFLWKIGFWGRDSVWYVKDSPLYSNIIIVRG